MVEKREKNEKDLTGCFDFPLFVFILVCQSSNFEKTWPIFGNLGHTNHMLNHASLLLCCLTWWSSNKSAIQAVTGCSVSEVTGNQAC